MNLICPCCQAIVEAALNDLAGRQAIVEAALNDLAGRQAIVEAFKLTPFGDLLLGYIKLFTPPKRALSNLRMVMLLEELLPMIRAASIERNGRIWSAPQEYWRMALGEMIDKRDKLTLPLKSHGYLLTIIEGYSNKAEAKKEAQAEAYKAGHTPVGGVPSSAGKKEEARPRSTIPAAVFEAIGKSKSQPGENDGNS